MQYINPFDLLGITTENLSEVNSYSINKSKRKLIAEIELSDTNTIVHNGVELNKGDCIKIIDELDNKDFKEFHFFIYGNLTLKKFLTTGDIGFFENFQTESIYNLPEFLDFISPFFSQQYDRILFDNYKHANQKNLIKLLANKPIVSASYYEKCFKTTYSYIKEIDNEIKNIISEISIGKSSFINKQFVGLDLLIVEKVNIELLNLLPSYFQSLRNQLAMSIRNLARDINNKPFEYFEPAFRIIEVAYNISIDALTKQTISKGYFVIKKNYEDEASKLEVANREDENRRIIAKWTEIENQLENILIEIIDGSSKFIPINFLSIDLAIQQVAKIEELNLLSKNFQGIRNRIAFLIQRLANTLNNDPYNNYKIAQEIILLAKRIIVDDLIEFQVKYFNRNNSTKNNDLENQKISKIIEQTYQAIQDNLDIQFDKSNQTKLNFGETKEVIITRKWKEKIQFLQNIIYEITTGKSDFIHTNFLSLDILILQIVDLNELNSLNSDFEKLRNEVAEKIFRLAEVVNNSPFSNHSVAFDIIIIATNIQTTSTSLINLQITDLRETIEEQIVNLKTNTSTKKTIDKENNNSKKDVSIEKTFNKTYSLLAQFNKLLEVPKKVKKKNIIFVIIIIGFILCVFYLIKHNDDYTKQLSSNKSESTETQSIPTTNPKNDNDVNSNSKYNKVHNLYLQLQEINSKQPTSNQVDLVSEGDFISDISNDTYDVLYNKWGDFGISREQFYDAFGINVKNVSSRVDLKVSEPTYIYPSMTNGNIKGCSNIKPEYDKNLDNSLDVSCGSNADVAVKMIDYSTDKSIRYVYIRKNTTYTIWNIPEGRYYLKIAYGDNWAIKEGESVCEGRFTTHIVFEKGKDILDYNLRHDSKGGTQVPSYSLKLNVIFHNNDLQMNKFSTNNISENEFYNE